MLMQNIDPVCDPSGGLKEQDKNTAIAFTINREITIFLDLFILAGGLGDDTSKNDGRGAWVGQHTSRGHSSQALTSDIQCHLSKVTLGWRCCCCWRRRRIPAASPNFVFRETHLSQIVPVGYKMLCCQV